MLWSELPKYLNNYDRLFLEHSEIRPILIGASNLKLIKQA